MLVRLIGSLFRFAISIVMLPLRMLSRNFIGTILLFGIIYIVWPKGEGTQPANAPTNKPATTRDAQGNPVPRIDEVAKQENGNSRFSTDMLSKMTPGELRYYSTAFFWAMRNQKEGIPYNWSYYNINGTLTPYSRFKNSFGHQCRSFDEVLKVHEIRQTYRGLACEREDGGWCRLRFDSTPLCGIGEQDKLLDGIGQKFKSLF